MRIDIMTLFPDAIEAMMGQSIMAGPGPGLYPALYPSDPGIYYQ